MLISGLNVSWPNVDDNSCHALALRQPLTAYARFGSPAVSGSRHVSWLKTCFSHRSGSGVGRLRCHSSVPFETRLRLVVCRRLVRTPCWSFWPSECFSIVTKTIPSSGWYVSEPCGLSISVYPVECLSFSEGASALKTFAVRRVSIWISLFGQRFSG